MSDEVKLLTYTNETISPVYDGILQELFTSGGGVITGGVVTIKDANTLHISDGYGALCGREFKIFASDIPVTLSSSGTLNGRLYLHMDLSQLTNPLQLLVEIGASLTPVQQDSNVNTTNGVYEINLATFSVGTSTISNLVSVAPTLKTLRAKTLQSVNDCGLSTDANDIAGAAALSELNSALDWKSVGEAFGNTNINLPADWRELSVVARYGTSSGLQSQTVPFRLTKASKGYTSIGGAGTIVAQLFINNDATTISLIYFDVNGTAYTATSKIYVWYR